MEVEGTAGLEDEDTTILRNNSKCLPADTV
jgi:hypothetical protein